LPTFLHRQLETCHRHPQPFSSLVAAVQNPCHPVRYTQQTTRNPSVSCFPKSGGIFELLIPFVWSLESRQPPRLAIAIPLFSPATLHSIGAVTTSSS
jgi:hypothetical protein